MEVWPACHTALPSPKVPPVSSVFCCHHLEILSNFGTQDSRFSLVLSTISVCTVRGSEHGTEIQTCGKNHGSILIIWSNHSLSACLSFHICALFLIPPRISVCMI